MGHHHLANVTKVSISHDLAYRKLGVDSHGKHTMHICLTWFHLVISTLPSK